MNHPTITFIGGGNMTRSLVSGLIAHQYAPQKICVTNRRAEKLAFFQDQLGVQTTQDNAQGARQAEVLVLSVEPLQLKTVCEELKGIVAEKKPLIISVINGATIALMQKMLGDTTAIVRTMPNTPASVRAGATGMVANTHTSVVQKNTAEGIMRAVGLALWLEDEDQMNLVTAVSGCGPAYLFLVMEAIQSAGEAMGLPAETARLLTLETVLGAARMALETEESVVQLRQFITAPGGSTERAIEALEAGNLRALIADAMTAAKDRAQELTKKLSE